MFTRAAVFTFKLRVDFRNMDEKDAKIKIENSHNSERK